MTERLTAEREAALVAEMRAGSTRARDELLRAVEPMLSRMAQKHAGSMRPDDLLQEGRLAALEALPAYDPQRGRFVTFVWKAARGAMADASNDAAAYERFTRLWSSEDEAGELGIDASSRVDAEGFLEEMGELERLVISCRLETGAGWKDVAAALNISAVYARQVYSRAIRRLRSLSQDPGLTGQRGQRR